MNIYAVLLVAFAIIWGVGIFLGVTRGITTGFQSRPTMEINSQELRKKQEQIVEDAEFQRKQLMDDYKRKARDQEMMRGF